MIEVQVTKRSAQRLNVKCPSNPKFNAELKKRCDAEYDRSAKVWHVDKRDEDTMRRLLREHFGTDITETRRCDVRIDLSQFYASEKRLELFGMTALERPGRDHPVELKKGFVLVAGQFEGSAGSRPNPIIGDTDGVIIEARDIPLGLIVKAQEEDDIKLEIIREDSTDPVEDSPQVIIETLRSELDNIKAQLAETQGELAQTKEQLDKKDQLIRLAQNSHAAAEALLDDMRDNVEDAQDALETATAEKVQLTNQLGDMKHKLNTAKKDNEQLARELRILGELHDELKAKPQPTQDAPAEPADFQRRLNAAKQYNIYLIDLLDEHGINY